MSVKSNKKIIFTDKAVPPLPIFSQAVVSNGRVVYLSGAVGCDKELKIVEGGVKAQTRAALENITTVLEASGTNVDHIVKVNIYLSNMPRDFGPMNEVYAEFFEKDKMPARTCVGVACLPLGADVEIECIADLPDVAQLETGMLIL